jgi:hypothetical protein
MCQGARKSSYQEFRGSGIENGCHGSEDMSKN